MIFFNIEAVVTHLLGNIFKILFRQTIQNKKVGDNFLTNICTLFNRFWVKPVRTCKSLTVKKDKIVITHLLHNETNFLFQNIIKLSKVTNNFTCSFTWFRNWNFVYRAWCQTVDDDFFQYWSCRYSSSGQYFQNIFPASDSL